MFWICKQNNSSLIGQCAGHVTRFLKSYDFITLYNCKTGKYVFKKFTLMLNALKVLKVSGHYLGLHQVSAEHKNIQRTLLILGHLEDQRKNRQKSPDFIWNRLKKQMILFVSVWGLGQTNKKKKFVGFCNQWSTILFIIWYFQKVSLSNRAILSKLEIKAQEN